MNEDLEISRVLEEIRNRYGVEPIVARDVGSRSRNLDSPDSDYDILVLFVQSPVDYVMEQHYKDNYEFSDRNVDVKAWNIKKFASLLQQNNPTVIEFLQSELEYYIDEDICEYIDELEEEGLNNFNPISLYYHYQSMAENRYKSDIQPSIYNSEKDIRKPLNEITLSEYVGEDGRRYPKSEWDISTTKPTAKNNLELVRSILYARHIRETGKLPPTNFGTFLMAYGGKYLTEREFSKAFTCMKMKKSGETYQDVGNPFKEIAEEEISIELDPQEYENRNPNSEQIANIARQIISQKQDSL